MLRSTTMLTGVVGAVFLATLTANAADAYTKAPVDLTKPAVDGVNGKLEALGGAYAKKSLYGVAGSVAVPLQGQFGAQVDGAVGSFDGRGIGVVAGHLFWRNPQQGLLGLYADHTEWNQYGGVHVSRFAGEGEGYWGRWTLQGMAGVEFGNNSSVGTSATSTTVVTPIVTTTTTTGTDLANVTRFFDRVSLSYYLTDDWKASVGHRYMGGKNSLALGTEYAMAVARHRRRAVRRRPNRRRFQQLRNHGGGCGSISASTTNR